VGTEQPTKPLRYHSYQNAFKKQWSRRLGSCPTTLGGSSSLSPEDYERFERWLKRASSSKPWKNRPAKLFTPKSGLRGEALYCRLQNLGAQASSPPAGRTLSLPKLLVFTEHRGLLNYLAARIRRLLSGEEARAMSTCGVKRAERRKARELFRNNPAVGLLVAIGAASEGVHLQNANLMVN